MSDQLRTYPQISLLLFLPSSVVQSSQIPCPGLRQWRNRWHHVIWKWQSHIVLTADGDVLFIFFLIFIFTLFYFTILYWFCHTLTWIHHGCTWVSNPEPPSRFLAFLITVWNYFIKKIPATQLLSFSSFPSYEPIQSFFKKNIWHFVMIAKANVFTAFTSQPGNLPVSSGIFWWNHCSTYSVLPHSPERIPLPINL